MKKMDKKLLGVVSVVFLMVLGTGRASAQEFSADMVNRIGNQTSQSKLNVSQDKMRMDMKEGVMIIRMDKGVSWMLMPSEKMYMENPIDMSRVPKASKNFSNEIERTPMGVETIDGKQAEKFKVTYTEKGKPVSVYQWIVNQQIPVKVEALDGSFSMEYKNVSMASQPADLFEIPSGYTKMSMPSFGDMGNMGGY